MLSDHALWRLYADAIANHAGVAAPDLFSPAAVTSFSGLGDAQPAVVNWSIFQLGNGIPASAGAYASRSGLFTAYWLCLSFLVEAAASMTRRGPLRPAALGDLLSTDLARYRRLLQARHLPLHGIAGRAVADAAPQDGQRAGLLGAHDALIATLDGRAPALSVAMNRCLIASLPEASELNMAASLYAGSTEFCCPRYSLGGWATGLGAWRSSPADLPPALSLTLPSPTTLASPRGLPATLGASAAPAAAPTPDPFVGAGWPAFLGLHMPNASAAVAERPALQRTAADGLLEGLTLTLAGFGVFPIQPGNWFDAELLEGGHATLPAGAPDFFGMDGALGLLPARAVIGFRPRLSLRAANSRLAQELAASVASIGPFSIRRAPAMAAALACSGCTGTEVRFDASDSNTPVLLGVISKPVRSVDGASAPPTHKPQ
ncbi:hypothetical protein CNE_BB1p13530 (plasmid) [Cupriavidus necator N-1]|uniref:Uncharacterized protein n=1 Tax=Cupriavidus necator (strain ATCC 43291 / DSM 13513 / CCUG 52238 / LMG 8453 / N-1) TaxID=1042878 RepID=F8GW63_CUPNN|nr:MULTISPECIES: hypothetical protein [Cupriavidus]AEI82752.1 hypothetical protein CNE_BB1p13530 [Cupriavidus necator N-1]EYS84992.1 hypothetical protein CF68_13840 [Cupriavidus sp. SK-4]MDX6007742.1 hypothetical protein [Cupriavidus necator]